MGLEALFFISLGLAMDASAVSITLGLRTCKGNKLTTALKAGLYFGFFQGLMPLIGWLLGRSFYGEIMALDHWIAFTLLSLLGGKMIIDSYKKEEEACIVNFSTRLYLSLAIATSIDALAVGITMAFLNVNIIFGVVIIALVTFILSFLAVLLGDKLGVVLKEKATAFGGIVLIIIGTKILLEHLGVGEVLLNLINR